MNNKKEFVARQPDFNGFLPVAAWVNVVEGKKQIKVKLGDTVTLNKYEPKVKEEEVI